VKSEVVAKVGPRGATVSLFRRLDSPHLYMRWYDMRRRNGRGDYVCKSLGHSDIDQAREEAESKVAALMLARRVRFPHKVTAEAKPPKSEGHVLDRCGTRGSTVSLVMRSSSPYLYLRWWDQEMRGGRGDYAWRSLRHSNVEQGRIQAERVSSFHMESRTHDNLVMADGFDWRRLFRSCQGKAKRRGIPFSLTLTDIDLIVLRAAGRCEVTNLPFSAKREKGESRRPWAPSIDRIDSAQGYTLENCRLVCVAVNYAMNQWGLDTLRRISECIVWGPQKPKPQSRKAQPRRKRKNPDRQPEQSSPEQHQKSLVATGTPPPRFERGLTVPKTAVTSGDEREI